MDKEKLQELISPAFILSLVMLGMIGYILFVVLNGESKYASETQALVIGAVLVQGIAEIRKYWFNSNVESVQKNDTINKQAAVIAATPPGGNGNGGETVSVDIKATSTPTTTKKEKS